MTLSYPIRAVARLTGISVDTLCVREKDAMGQSFPFGVCGADNILTRRRSSPGFFESQWTRGIQLARRQC